VVVLEASDKPLGGCRTDKTIPGYLFNTHAAVSQHHQHDADPQGAPHAPHRHQVAGGAPAVAHALHATYSSWISQVERFFAFITADLLVRSEPPFRAGTREGHLGLRLPWYDGSHAAEVTAADAAAVHEITTRTTRPLRVVR